jgi:hypothetical protein
MNILRLTSAAAIAAASLGIGGAAYAGPALNLSTGQQDTATTTDAVQPVYHYGYGYYPYYGYRPYYRPYYQPYYYRPYYRPYYYSYPYYRPSFGIYIR